MELSFEKGEALRLTREAAVKLADDVLVVKIDRAIARADRARQLERQWEVVRTRGNSGAGRELVDADNTLDSEVAAFDRFLTAEANRWKRRGPDKTRSLVPDVDPATGAPTADAASDAAPFDALGPGDSAKRDDLSVSTDQVPARVRSGVGLDRPSFSSSSNWVGLDRPSFSSSSNWVGLDRPISSSSSTLGRSRPTLVPSLPELGRSRPTDFQLEFDFGSVSTDRFPARVRLWVGLDRPSSSSSSTLGRSRGADCLASALDPVNPRKFWLHESANG